MPKALRLWLALNVAAFWGCAKNESTVPSARFEQASPKQQEAVPEAEPQTLMDAVRLRNLNGVQTCLIRGDDVNIADKSGATAFQVSMMNGASDIARALSSHAKLDLTKLDPQGHSYLFLAAQNGDVEVLRNLIAAIRRDPKLTFRMVDPPGLDGQRAIHAAADSQIMQLLFEAQGSDFDLTITDQMGRTPVHTAAANGRDQTLAWINKQYCGSSKWLPSYVESARNYIPVNALRNPLNRQDINAQTPIMLAVQASSYLATKELLTCPYVDLSTKDNKNRTVFHWAAMQSDYQVLDALLTTPHPDWRTMVDMDGNSPLHYAAFNGQTFRLYDRLRNDADGARVDQQNNAGYTPQQLHRCLWNRQFGISNDALAKECGSIRL